MCRHFIYERELRSCWHERKHIFCCIPFGEENKNQQTNKTCNNIFISFFLLYILFLYLFTMQYLFNVRVFILLNSFIPVFFFFLHVYNLLFDWLFSLFHFCRESPATQKNGSSMFVFVLKTMEQF